MKKAILFCYSFHHGNTKKVAEAVCARYGIRLVSVPVKEEVNLSDYALVGFASGIYMSDFGKPIREYASSLTGLEGKDCFTLFTHGAPKGAYDQAFVDLLKNKGAHMSGRFGCRGFDTFGPFKLVGGIAKGHPNTADVAGAAEYFSDLLKD
ncbi:MAG TPA: flavodoxin domain-containing protein [Feifaniaceae bacterium]|nr:flavodoxin domain-containing protein [Feifaniaceae bacterium]